MKPVQAIAGRPLYATVKDAVRDAIDRGEFAPGDQLPSTKALADQLSVSLVTVHRALQELVTSGVLRRGQGKGTFVHEHYSALTSKATGLRFGLVFHVESSLADSYHGQIFEGVRQRSTELGIDLVLLRFGEDWRNECQGYLYVNPFEQQLAKPPRFNAKKNDAQHLMVVGASFDRDSVSCVDTDNADMARQALRRFRAAGHTRIGFLGGDDSIANNTDRWLGFLDAARLAGLSQPDALSIRSPGWRLDDEGRHALRAMLTRKDRPTAIFAAGYYYALDIYAIAAELGLSIPGDISLIGIDDPPSAAHLSPALTTFRQPLVQLGRLAVNGLYEVATDDDLPPQRTTLKAQLIERDSVAPPA